MNIKPGIFAYTFVIWFYQSIAIVVQAQSVMVTENSISNDTQKLIQSNLIEKNTMNNEIPGISGSRGRPPQVSAIVYKNIVYKQLVSPSTQGLNPYSGYVIATEKSTGKQLWIAEVYRVEENPELESDIQRIFFKSMQLAPTCDALLIEDENRQHYRVSLSNGVVTLEK